MTRELIRFRPTRVLTATLAALVLVAAACGDDDDGSSATSAGGAVTTEGGAVTTAGGAVTTVGGAVTTAGGAVTTAGGGVTTAGGAVTTMAAPSGEPIKVMSVTTLNAAGPTYQNIANTAEYYANYINARGGIAGRPLEVTVCDEQFDPAVATTCGRQAVEEGMVAVVGSFTYFAESIVPVIAEAGIDWFGPCCPIAPSELTSEYSFPIGNQPMYAVGAVSRAVEDGCQKINAVITEGAEQIFRPPMENAIKALGMEFGTTMTVTETNEDYSADVAQALTGDPDCVIMILSETPFIRWNTAWTQSGTEARQYGPQGNLNAVSAAGNEEATDGDVIAGMYPDLSTEPWAEYRTALEENGADLEAIDYNSLGGMGTWAAYDAFTQVAETIDGEVTAESFHEAASNTSELDLNGMVPVLDFTTPWTDGLEGYPRLFNRSVVFSQLDNGEVVPLTTDFQDVGDLAMGIAPD